MTVETLKQKKITKPDGIIFDMDGTLWDALDIYVEAWNRGLRALKINRTMTRAEIVSLVGSEWKILLDKVLPGYHPDVHEKVFIAVNELSSGLVHEMQGIVYDGVREGLAELSKNTKLFIVSNCAEGAIQLFMKQAGINEYITDEIAYGVNFMPKNHNIKLLIDKHDLKNPIYVGDTNGDSEQSRLAGIPFVFMSFGFGTTDNYDLKFNSFVSFTDHFLNMK